jgi:hypothetical protein
MSYIKTFENFSSTPSPVSIYVANPEAESLLFNDEVYESLVNEGFYYSVGVEKAIALLERAGYSSPRDFAVFTELDEKLEVKYAGHESKPDGVEIHVEINGHKYGYSQKEGGLDIGDIARKFEKMLQFSAGKALTWLKKNTVLTAGSASTEANDTKTLKEGKEIEDEVVVDTEVETPLATEETPKTSTDNVRHYMFFQNLKTIKTHIDMMMSLDPSAIDELLGNGHDWAADHIATSKDDVEEVCGWLCANLK